MSRRHQNGSAPVETIFAIVLLMILVLGAIETAFVLYGRNVVSSSAHESARAAIEIGRDPAEARSVAIETVRRASGSFVSSLRVTTRIQRIAGLDIARVTVTGILRPPGPLPIAIPIRSTSTVTRRSVP